jgi:hypothetical protein
MVPYVSAHADIPVARVTDPTLLLTPEDYNSIASSDSSSSRGKYLLLYTRRYNPMLETFAIDYAANHGLRVVEISLRAKNADIGHEMRYDAGVEEFLSLMRDASFVVTNSFHGLIFAVQYSRPFAVFSRETGDSKIGEVLGLFGLSDRLIHDGTEYSDREFDFAKVHERIDAARRKSIEFLRMELSLL